MSYTRPAASAASFSWSGLAAYERPASTATTASWVDTSGDPQIIAAGPSPLEAPAGLMQVDPLLVASGPSPLGAPAGLAWVDLYLHASAPGILSGAEAVVHHDWTSAIRPEAPTYYVMDITGSPTLRVPISSWQATVQTGRATYVQAVVPAAVDWVAALAARVNLGEIVISRGTLAPDGSALEMELARGPLMTVTSDRGTQRNTCTVSGYGAPYDPGAETWPETTRTLTSPRTISQTGSNHRVRCAIDWALRPGMTAVLDDLSFPVAYINYYVGNGDAYMDVGSRVA